MCETTKHLLQNIVRAKLQNIVRAKLQNKNYKTFLIPKTTKQNEKLQNISKNYKTKTTKRKLQIKNYKTNMIPKKERAEAPSILLCNSVQILESYSSSFSSLTLPM